MTLEDLQPLLRARPFKAFRLYVSGGETFDVRHSELCMAGLTSVIIGFPSEKDEDSLAYSRYTVIDLEHVIRVEPLESLTKKGA